ncbi:MAG: class I SAM-dependent methyltransferase [Pirellulales bacterium]
MPADPANSTTRFGDRVADYVRYRPDYPDGVLHILRRELGLSSAWRIADVGAGTGILTARLLANGNVVDAVEPNAAMRAAADERLGGLPGYHSHDGAAEATGLPDGAIDCVTAAQAMHWFDAPRAHAEFRRILRPDGAITLVWNRRLLDATPFLRDYEALLKLFATDYGAVRHELVDDAKLDVIYGGRVWTKHVLPNLQRFDFAGLRGRLLSSSYAPNIGQPGHDPMLQELTRIFAAHQRDGAVEILYETDVYCGKIA